MKICFIVGAFPMMKCGVGDYTSKLAEELAKDGNEIHIITSERASSESKSLNVHNIVKEWKFSALKPILNELKKIQPDVVNIQYPSDEYYRRTVSVLPILIKRKIKCKVTITVHEYDYFNLNENRLKDKIRLYLNFCKLDKIITVEEKFIPRIKKDYSKANIAYIPISSNIPRNKAKAEDLENIRKKYELEGKKVLSYFGFAVPVKGIEYLLKCVQKLDDDVKLLFINHLDENNEYHKTLLDLIKELKIEEKVAITGFIDDAEDVANLLEASDICVLPFVNGLKKSNGSFLAAYNQKIKIITTSNKEEVEEKGIYYVKPNQEQELLEKIQYALEKEEEIDRDILTWDNVVKSYLESFNEVM
ncbi:MAG: glycosyltransferase [Clostridia bacterium]|nr:glycosyltransferase [Clostridia bacterium]